MKKTCIKVLILALALPFGFCAKEETGNCKLSCDNGFGQLFTSKTFHNKTVMECAKLGESEECKATYCPPTGNVNDCYTVHTH